MNTEKFNSTIQSVELCILKILSAKFSTVENIKQKLNDLNIQADSKVLFPVLSKLNLYKFLCYTWKKTDAGLSEKIFFITPNGESYLKNLALN